jgi:hypothetical protein
MLVVWRKYASEVLANHSFSKMSSNLINLTKISALLANNAVLITDQRAPKINIWAEKFPIKRRRSLRLHLNRLLTNSLQVRQYVIKFHGPPARNYGDWKAIIRLAIYKHRLQSIFSVFVFNEFGANRVRKWTLFPYLLLRNEKEKEKFIGNKFLNFLIKRIARALLWWIRLS